MSICGKKPDWLKVRIAGGPNCARLEKIIEGKGLNTVCREALCPNIGKCWEHGRATLMILGKVCTRGCRFCNVVSVPPVVPDETEPERVAEAVKDLGLSSVVITSVTRDDLADGGARIWAETIRRVRDMVPDVLIEVLVPDFSGSIESVQTVLNARPAILGHNVETVASLYNEARPGADYDRSLNLLARAHDEGFITKTAIMLGLGETESEVLDVMRDAVKAGVDIFFAGQYLQPTKAHMAVSRYVEPAEFEFYRKEGRKAGFKVVVSGPLVRSSYHSDEQEDFVMERLHAHERAV